MPQYRRLFNHYRSKIYSVAFTLTKPAALSFYVFFPQDAHRQNLQAENYTGKKIVIKVKSG